MHIVYSSDNHYVQHVGVSMTSLFENHRHVRNIDVYLIENGIAPENKEKLQGIGEAYGRVLRFIPLEQIAHKLNLNIGNSISVNSYARLFLAGVLPEHVDRVIYLDCDSVVDDSLEPLWNLDLEDCCVAGVRDTVSATTKRKVNLQADGDYINAGMLVINLRKWREDGIESRFLSFIDRYDGRVFHHDQGVINGVLSGNMRILHPKYNAMTTFFTMKRDDFMQYYGMDRYYSEAEIGEAVNRPAFVHYTPAFVNRPWIKGNKHPLARVYHAYLAKTPWRGTQAMPDRRGGGEKLVAMLYTKFPFRIANRIANLMLK